jgi:WD40 repeat protein
VGSSGRCTRLVRHLRCGGDDRWFELEEWEPGAIEAGRLEELRLDAQDLRLEAALQGGHHREVLTSAKAMVSAAPLREQRWTLLALAQYRAGRQSDALRTLQNVRRMLVQELGLDPGPDIDALEQAILRQDASLLVEVASTPHSAACPYRGLTPYDVEDAEGYFGRDTDVAACLDRLRQQGVLAVVGPSGSGKSSLVRAGIAASLERDGQQVTVSTPEVLPLDTLSGLCPGKAGHVLVVDQCEEVFSQCDDPAERATFLAQLVDRAKTAPVVISLRADHLGDISGHPGFARLVERGLYLLGAMSDDDLRAAIEGPARQAGLVVEPGLVDLLVREVEGEPGALPLLSHALRETWLRREGRTLTVSGYQASGGIRGAVAKSAEEVYGRTAPDQRHLLRDTMLRLVAPGMDGEPVRSRIARRQVVSDPAQDRLIDLLIEARLVTSDDGVLQLAHEALARAWPRLRAWLDDDVEGRRILHHLTNAADAWDALGRPDSETYRGIRLAQTIDWRDRTHPALTKTERAFLEEGVRLAAAEEQSAEERARHQVRVNRRLRGVLAGAIVLLVAALAAGGLAVQQKRVADDSAAAARDAATTAQAGRAGARAVAAEDIDKSLLLAVAGVRLDDSPDTRSSLLAALGRYPELIASTQLAGPVAYFDVSPDGRTVVTWDLANHVRLYEIDTARLLAEYQAGSTKTLSWQTGQVKFSPDGHTIAVTVAAPTRQPIMLLDADTLEPLRVQPGGLPRMRWQLLDFAYSQDGHHLAGTMFRVQGHGRTTRSTTTWAAAWNLESPRRPIRLFRLQPGNPFVALSPDGGVMYTTQPLTIHDLASGTSSPVEGTEPGGPIAMSPDGRVLATAGKGGLLLLDTGTGQVRRRLQGNDDDGWFVNFSGDGSLVGVVTFDKQEAVVWDVATGAVRAQVPLHERSDLVDFGVDGSTVYTAGDSSLRHWDLDGDRRFVAQLASTPDLSGDCCVQPAPGGGFVAYQNEDHVTFLDVKAGTVGEAVDAGRDQGYRHGEGSWRPDGVHYAVANGGEVRILNARSGVVTANSQPSGTPVSGIDYSTDGSRLVIGQLSGRVTMLDSTTLDPVDRAVRLEDAICCLSAGPDNRTAIAVTGFVNPSASGFWDDSTSGWALVDLESGTVLDQGELGFNGRLVAFSPDGRHAAVGGSDGELLVLDTKTGEPIRRPMDAHDLVASLSYSADGKRILTSGLDATVALWDAQTGRPLSRLVTPERLLLAGFGKDPDSVLIATLFGGPVYEWNTRGDYAIDFACKIAGRDLTKAEWRENVGDRPYHQTCPA